MKTKIHQMHLQERPFRQILAGEKTIELRVNDEKRRSLRVGDTITFVSMADDNQNFLVKITNLHYAANFAALAEYIDVPQTGFESKEQMIEGMKPHYPIEEQEQFGVVSIEFELC